MDGKFCFDANDESSLSTFDAEAFEEYLDKLDAARDENLNKLTKGSQSFLGNSLLTSILSTVISTTGSLTNNALIDLMSRPNELTNAVLQYVAAAVTIQDQMQLAMYAIIVDSLKANLITRIDMLTTLKIRLQSMRDFLVKYDLASIASNEWLKLEAAELDVHSARRNIRNVKNRLQEFNRFNAAAYNAATLNLEYAFGKLGDTYINPLEFSFNELFQQYKTDILDDFQIFLEDANTCLSLIPAGQDVLTAFTNIGNLTTNFYLSLIGEDADLKGSTLELLDNVLNLNGIEVQSPLIRSLTKEVVDFDTTWDSFQSLGNLVAEDIINKCDLVSNLDDRMISTLYPDPNNPNVQLNPTELAFKNIGFQSELVTLIPLFKSTPALAETFDDIYTDYEALAILKAACENYPEKEEHPAEVLTKEVLTVMLQVVAGVFTAGGITNALNSISNLIVRCDKALQLDTDLLSVAALYNVSDLVSVQLANTVLNNNADLLESFGFTALSAAFRIGTFSNTLSYVTTISANTFNLIDSSDNAKDGTSIDRHSPLAKCNEAEIEVLSKGTTTFSNVVKKYKAGAKVRDELEYVNWKYVEVDPTRVI